MNKKSITVVCILHEPGHDLYRAVRARLVERGTSLNAWCSMNGVQRQNVRQCLLGSWDGPKARRLRERLLQEAGIAS